MKTDQRDISFDADIIEDAYKSLGEEYSKAKVRHVFNAYFEFIHWKVKQKGVISFYIQNIGSLYLKTNTLRLQVDKMLKKIRISDRYNVINLIQKYHRLNSKLVRVELLKETAMEPGHYQFRLNDKPTILESTLRKSDLSLMALEMEQNSQL
jgi:hypothetical protein